MNIRKLTKADYPLVLPLFQALDQLHVDARPDWFIMREDVYPEKDYDEVISSPRCLMLGAFDSTENLIGLSRATLWEESGMVKGCKIVCLDSLYVLPEYRHQGIATKLFRQVESWATEKGATRLELHAWSFNTSALALYEVMGMKPQRFVLEKNL